MFTQTEVRRFTSTYISGLKPGATKRDISDPVIPGLVLRIGVTGCKSWLLRFKWEGRPTRISLGTFPSLGLAEARQLAPKNRDWLDQGIDPRRAADRASRRIRAGTIALGSSEPTTARTEAADPRDFAKLLAETPRDSIPKPLPGDGSSVLFIAYEYIEVWFKAQRKNCKEACRMLRADVLPKWHWRDGRTITSREVIELLDVVVKRGAPVMANNLAQTLGHMFRFAIHRSILTNSPVQLLYKPGGKPRRRNRVLSEDELRSFVKHLPDICRKGKRAHVLMVLLLTMQRRSELGLAEWKEFDFDDRRWKIPASHSKNKREHAVPLTSWAIAELKALKLLANGSRFVLPGKNLERHADPKLITRGVKRLLPAFLAQSIGAFVPHDLRRTGRTTLGRLGVSPFVGERVINHSKDVLEETYDLWDYFDEKRDALERLETYLLQLRDSERAGTAMNAKQVALTRQRGLSGARSRLKPTQLTRGSSAGTGRGETGGGKRG
jgi:integrase